MPTSDLYLVCRVLTQLCALPLEHVSETMRPLPVVAIPGGCPPVCGVAIVRGAPVPVVDVVWVLARKHSHATRFVSLNVGGRGVALAVDAVLGVRTIPAESRNELPPLLRDVGTDVVATIGTLDAELLMVLRGARLVSESVWSALEASGTLT